MRVSPLSLGIPLAEVTRRDEPSGREVVESIHPGHLVVVGPDGQVVASAGDPDAMTFVRSTAKPLQSIAALELLGGRGDELSDAEVAVSWSSHRGEPRHLAAVATLLERTGTPSEQLTCPPAAAESTPGATPSRIQHNCSGKHAMFALAGRAAGTSREALLEPTSGLQRFLLEQLAQRLGGIRAVGTDGCGAPAVAAPLVGLARAYAGLATCPWGRRIREAGFAQPLLVGGEDRLESALLAAGVVAKVGAEGIYAVGWTDRDGGGWGLGLKATDGSTRGVAAATAATLEGLGAVPSGTWAPPPPLGGGRPVGRVRPADALGSVIASVGGAAAR